MFALAVTLQRDSKSYSKSYVKKNEARIFTASLTVLVFPRGEAFANKTQGEQEQLYSIFNVLAMAGLSQAQVHAVFAALSQPRISRYLVACASDQARALALYRWNAQASAAFMVPMHICEITLRNAIVGAIQDVYGVQWYVPGSAFERSLPKPNAGYSPARDLHRSRKNQPSAGKVIPELKFMFWVSMLTARHDARLWRPYLAKHFPALPVGLSASAGRLLLHSRLDDIRKLRNRLAHHEPVFDRILVDEYEKIADVVRWVSPETMNWLSGFESVTRILRQRP
jgi:hypothetical protein